MHEASIAMSIIGIAEERCKEAGYDQVSSISVRIGSASGVLPDVLAMAFDIVKLDTLAKVSMLNIDEIPLGGDCIDCASPFTTEDQFILSCPDCGSNKLTFTTGREMEITQIEVD